MEKNYDPAKIEAKWYARWQEQGLFHGETESGGEPYCVMIPPPNVTGILHMGHALNNTIQDILVRWRRMQGRNTVWMPGTDHAGIATQNVVERQLKKEGLTREDLGREAFIERVWKWREEYGGTIIRQLKRLGCSCDWERERFTMDEGLSRAVEEVFVRLYNKGLIYRANYIINWCSRCHTALSDEESEHQPERGNLYYIKYPVEGDAQRQFITVATTRPETLLGDTAIAFSPDDERYAGIDDAVIRLPILERPLRVIRDELVDPAFGTGAVKVTPAHDPNDFMMGQRHKLESINVMNIDGTMNEECGPYAGMDRFECRKKIVADLQAAGLIEKIEPHEHAVGHCYRCDTVVEPRLSPQWFVKMKPLAKPAIESVRSGEIKFTPERWTGFYLDWMENIRDWCISRQIWWGHRIPVFTCSTCGHEWAACGKPEQCPDCGAGNPVQDPDVLDTWFSSWLWPFTTLGWPEEKRELKYYYPTNDLVTASEIIFFWVARMIMAGHEFMGEAPFTRVYIHGTVRDDHGRKMSKSLGNSIDPITVIESFSADALRFSLMMITATGQDVFLSDDKFEIGRNFATKLWNAARFMQMNAGERKVSYGPDTLDSGLLSADDRQILYRLQAVAQECNNCLERYRFNDAAHALYEFVWHQYCDWYLEYAKADLRGADEARRGQVLAVMNTVFEEALRLLHPIMPFVTEELWHAMGYGADEASIMTAEWPRPWDETRMMQLALEKDIAGFVDDKHELIRSGRMLRADYGIEPARAIAYQIKPVNVEIEQLLNADIDSLKVLLRASQVTINHKLEIKQAMPVELGRLGAIYMPLAGVVDVAAEQKRLSQQLEKTRSDLERITAKLENTQFTSKAPAEVVQRQRDRREELVETMKKQERIIEMLGS